MAAPASALPELRRFPWYDSGWLSSYVACRELIRERHPRRLEEFERAFEPFRTAPDFRTRELAGVLAPEELEQARAIVRGLEQESLEKHEFFQFGRFVLHDHPYFRDLQRRLTAKVSEWAGEAVEPAYNFLSLYNTLGVCEPHLDAPNAKWTLDICIDQSREWPIFIGAVRPWPEQLDPSPGWNERVRADPGMGFREHVHPGPGTALLFSGSAQWHYRNRISAAGGQKNFSHLLFLHYLPANMRHLFEPSEWARFFGIPELAALAFRESRSAVKRV